MDPCILCREESISASKGKYCTDCYIKQMLNTFIEDYPISVKELIDRWHVKDV